MSWDDKSDPVVIGVDRFIQLSENAVLVEVCGTKEWVAKSKIDNLDDVLKHMAHPTSESAKVEHIEVPLWLAVENGWEDDPNE